MLDTNKMLRRFLHSRFIDITSTTADQNVSIVPVYH